VQCGADIPDPGKAVEGGYGAVLDGGIYYGTYNPYDPATRPVLVLNGPAVGYRFIALDSDRSVEQPLESLHVLDLTVVRTAQWYSVLNFTKLICSRATT
jgi:hypothetical protein